MTSLLPGSGEQKLTPQAILDMNYAFARTAILVAFVRLRLFTYLANQPLTPVELATCADTVPELTERLLQGLELLGLVEREGNAYRLTPMADHFLVERKSSYAQYYPSVQITALDLPGSVKQGRQQIASMGLTDRYTWIEADMETFTFPSFVYDLIICGHICRFMSDERTRTLLNNLAGSLRPGGTLIVADVFLSEDRKDPPPPAITLDLSMKRKFREVASKKAI